MRNKNEAFIIYKNAVGGNPLHLCSHPSNQPIYEELLARKMEYPALYEESMDYVRMLHYSLIKKGKLRWPGGMYQNINQIELLNSLIEKYT